MEVNKLEPISKQQQRQQCRDFESSVEHGESDKPNEPNQPNPTGNGTNNPTGRSAKLESELQPIKPNESILPARTSNAESFLVHDGLSTKGNLWVYDSRFSLGSEP